MEEDVLHSYRRTIHEVAYYYVDKSGNVQRLLESSNPSIPYDINGLGTIHFDVHDELHELKCPSIRHNDITLVMAACNSGSIELLDYLVSKGADVHKESPVCGPPVAFAASCISIDINVLKWLIDFKGAKVGGAVDIRGRTPLMLACLQDCSVEVFEYLLAKDISVINQKDHFGYSAIHMAAASGRLDLLKLLISRGAELLFGITGDPLSHSYVPCPLYLSALLNTQPVTEYLTGLPQCSNLCRLEANFVKTVRGLLFPKLSNSMVFIQVNDIFSRVRSAANDLLSGLASEVSAGMSLSDDHPRVKLLGILNHLVTRTPLPVSQGSHFIDAKLYVDVFLLLERILGSVFCNPMANSTIWLPIHTVTFDNCLSGSDNANHEMFEHFIQRIIATSLTRLTMNRNYDLSLYRQMTRNCFIIIRKLFQTAYNRSPGHGLEFYIKCFINLLNFISSIPSGTAVTPTTITPSYLIVWVFRYIIFCFHAWLATNTSSVANAAIDHKQSSTAAAASVVVPSSQMEDLVHEFIVKAREVQHQCGTTILHRLCTMYLSRRRSMIKQPTVSELAKLVEMLCEFGCYSFINQMDSDGNRPLHMAVKCGAPPNILFRKEILVSCFLKYGAHIDAVDKDGRMPIEYCSDRESKVYTLLHVKGPHPLLCCVSRYIVSQHIQYDSIDLPQHVINYVRLHDTKHI